MHQPCHHKGQVTQPGTVKNTCDLGMHRQAAPGENKGCRGRFILQRDRRECFSGGSGADCDLEEAAGQRRRQLLGKAGQGQQTAEQAEQGRHYSGPGQQLHKYVEEYHESSDDNNKLEGRLYGIAEQLKGSPSVFPPGIGHGLQCEPESSRRLTVYGLRTARASGDRRRSGSRLVPAPVERHQQSHD
ncbi:hypothetical protein D3C73_1143220 [compost metagenome]